MRSNLRRGFTLIELLVVIAIIAILAAILFPVFAQAREKARQSTCISNNKQLSLATLQYIQDYDETYPMAFGDYGTDGWDYLYVGYTPPNWVCPNGQCGPKFTGDEQSYWMNAIQPYTKNYQVLICPDSTVDSGLKDTQAAGAPKPAKTSFTYNGFLQSSTVAVVASPAQLPLMTESAGNVVFNGFQGANPILICDDGTKPCRYNRGGTGNGSTSGVFGNQPGTTLGIHGKGQTFGYADGHAKFAILSLDVLGPGGRTDRNREPWAYYGPGGTIGAWYTKTGFIRFFCPDNTFDSSF